MKNRAAFARLAQAAVMGSCVVFAASAHAQSEKAPEDPTKIATKAGLSYADELYVSGSVAVGSKFKFNGRVSESGLWSIGASYLFPVAILTFSASKNELDTGVEQTRYSLGGFAPLARLGLKTGKWNVFVPFGYTHTKGEQTRADVDQDEEIPVAQSSDSAYVGLFGFRPINRKLTVMAGGNWTRGTHDFSGVSLGGGLSYHLGKDDSLGLSASYMDNSYGQKKQLRVSYRHEF